MYVRACARPYVCRACVTACLWCVRVVCVHVMCTCGCWGPVPSCVHLYSAVAEMHAGSTVPGQGQRNFLFPWPCVVIKSPNSSLTIISSK